MNLRSLIVAASGNQGAKVRNPRPILLYEKAHGFGVGKSASPLVSPNTFQSDYWRTFSAIAIFAWSSKPVDKQDPRVTVAQNREPALEISFENEVLALRLVFPIPQNAARH